MEQEELALAGVLSTLRETIDVPLACPACAAANVHDRGLILCHILPDLNIS